MFALQYYDIPSQSLIKYYFTPLDCTNSEDQNSTIPPTLTMKIYFSSKNMCKENENIGHRE